MEGLADIVADTCTSLRHHMDLPIGIDEDDSAQSPKDEAPPQAEKGRDQIKESTSALESESCEEARSLL